MIAECVEGEGFRVDAPSSQDMFKKKPKEQEERNNTRLQTQNEENTNCGLTQFTLDGFLHDAGEKIFEKSRHFK